MKKRDAHKGFVFMSKIDLVDEALKIASGMPWSDLDVRNPLFVKNHSEQKGHRTPNNSRRHSRRRLWIGMSHVIRRKTRARRTLQAVRVGDAATTNWCSCSTFGRSASGERADAREGIPSGMSTPEGLTQAIGRVMRHNAKDPRPGARDSVASVRDARRRRRARRWFRRRERGPHAERASSSKGEGETSAKPKKRRGSPTHDWTPTPRRALTC